MSDETQLVASGEAVDLETMKRADLPVLWDGYRAKVEKLKATAETLTITDVSQKAEMKIARQTRLTLKDIRVEIEHRRKELGEEALRRKQGIDAAAKELRELIEPLETRLLDQEQFIEREEARILAEEVKARTEQLAPFWNPAIPMPELGTLTDRQFEIVLEETKAAHEAKLAAAKKAEDDRIAKEKKEAADRKKIADEIARLKKEAADREARAAKEREAALAREMALQEIQGIQQQAIIAIVGRGGVRRGGTIECLEETLEETKQWLIDDHFGPLESMAQAAKDKAIAEIEAALTQKRADVLREKQETEKREAVEAKARKEKAAADAKAKAEREKAEEAARAAAEAARKEREAIEAKAKAEREESERLAAIERKKIEDAAKAAAEHAKKEQAKRDAAAKVAREAAEAKAREEREAREKLEAEIAAAKAAATKAEVERLAAERKAAMAPEKEKLKAFAESVRELRVPMLASDEGIAAVLNIGDKVKELVTLIEDEAENL